METWYLLYGGQSVDGMGEGQYIGRTTDANKAMAHYIKCDKNPYSTGKVMIVNDTKIERAYRSTVWPDKE